MASSPELEHVQGVWERMRGNSPIYDFLLDSVVIVSASKGAVTSRLTLGKNHVNSRGTIHGAVSAALVDWSGGLAVSLSSPFPLLRAVSWSP
jgi:acyl-coenzyme A thioesterase 13